MPHRIRHALRTATVLVFSLQGCGPGESPDPLDEVAADDPPMALADRLAAGQSVFGIFSGPMTREQGEVIAGLREADFVLYSLESGPFDLDTMDAYLEGLRAGAAERGVPPQPVLLRVPPIHVDTAAAPDHVARAMERDIGGIVYPHVTSPEEAARSVRYLGEPWPLGDDGLDVLIVEDREGVANIRAIMATPGLSVVFAGPGDLTRAYDGDMQAVENAIQTVLSACLEFEVACGVTAGTDDIGTRLDQGFRVIIVTEEPALAVGRRHVGR